MLQHKVAGLPHVHQFMSQLSALVHFFVCLSDKVLVLFPGRKIEGVGHKLGTLSLARFQIFVFLFNSFPFDVLAHFESRIASADNRDVINNTAVFHFTVWAFNEAVLIDAGVTAQRRDESDVWTFRCLNWTDTTVVCRVYVAHFKSCALSRQTAWPERR